MPFEVMNPNLTSVVKIVVNIYKRKLEEATAICKIQQKVECPSKSPEYYF